MQSTKLQHFCLKYPFQYLLLFTDNEIRTQPISQRIQTCAEFDFAKLIPVDLCERRKVKNIRNMLY